VRLLLPSRPQFLAAGNTRLNLLLAGCVFETHTGFAGKPAEVEDITTLDSDSREERAFRMWINSCGIPGVFINNLFMDCRLKTDNSYLHNHCHYDHHLHCLH
jgi:hypothetical protein